MTEGPTELERRALREAVDAARSHRGDVEPNPTVGAAVIARGAARRVVGAHERYGGPHAEVVALAAARGVGLDPAGATVVVTLEPCSTQGKTPPCVDALLAAGVARVVVGAVDPNPAHAGAGLERLAAAGVDVVRCDGAEADACAALLADFVGGLASRRPHVVAKWAMSRDGAIAPARGLDGVRPRAILSGPDAHALVQRWRASLDALVVGAGTVADDDPRLTVRGTEPLRPLRRVVLDPALRTPTTARVVGSLRDGFEPDESPAATWFCAADDAPDERERVLVDAGARVLRVPAREGVPWVAACFDVLAVEGVGRAMVEGGAVTLRRAFDAGVVDAAAVFVAPVELGEGALAALDGWPLGPVTPDDVARRLGLRDVRVEPVGDDLLVRGRV